MVKAMKSILHTQRTVMAALCTIVLAACNNIGNPLLIPTVSATASSTSTATNVPPTETTQPTASATNTATSQPSQTPMPSLTPTPALPPGQAYETVLGVSIPVNTNAGVGGSELTIQISQAAADELGIKTATMDPAIVDKVFEDIRKVPYQKFGIKPDDAVTILGVKWDSRYGYLPSGGMITGVINSVSELLVNDPQYEKIKEAIDPQMKYVEYYETDNGINPDYKVLIWFGENDTLNIVVRVIPMYQDKTKTANFNYFQNLNSGLVRGIAAYRGLMRFEWDSSQFVKDLGCNEANKYCLGGNGAKLVIH